MADLLCTTDGTLIVNVDGTLMTEEAECCCDESPCESELPCPFLAPHATPQFVSGSIVDVIFCDCIDCGFDSLGRNIFFDRLGTGNPFSQDVGWGLLEPSDTCRVTLASLFHTFDNVINCEGDLFPGSTGNIFFEFEMIGPNRARVVGKGDYYGSSAYVFFAEFDWDGLTPAINIPNALTGPCGVGGILPAGVDCVVGYDGTITLIPCPDA